MTINEKVRNCPYHQEEIVVAEDHQEKNETLTSKVVQKAYDVVQSIGEYCPYAVGWTKNSFSYYYDGNIPALFKIMRIGDTQTFERYKVVPIAHKFKCIVITDPDIIKEILNKFRDGKEWSGGPEFEAVRYVTGETNPLTQTDKSKQGILKSFTMNNHFSPTAIKNKALEFMCIADSFVQECFEITDEYDTFNITNTLPEYTLKISARVILGVDSSYSELIDVIGTLEGLATDMIVCNPNAFVPNFLDSSRSTSQDELKRAVRKIVKDSEGGDGITAKMNKEPRYNKNQAEHFKKVKAAISNSKDLEEQEVIEKIYNLISSKFYQSHFFELAEEYEYDIPNIQSLKDMKRSDLNDIDGNFFQSLKDNGEIKAFLNILSLMIASKDSHKFDKQQIADMVKTVLIIGSGTTKSAIVSSIYCLLENPEEQEKLYQALKGLGLNLPTEEEVEEFQKLTLQTVNQWQYASILDVEDELIKKDPNYKQYLEIRKIPLEKLTEEQFNLLMQMKFTSVNNTIHEKIMNCEELDHFVREVLRMFPPIAVQARKAKEKVQIGDLTVPEGWTVFLANIVSNNDETRWENPTKFDPSRFEDPKAPRTHPFNYGINQCMGRFQALSSIKAIVYTLLMKYKVLRPVNFDDEEIEQKFILSAGVALKFDKPLWARFEERI